MGSRMQIGSSGSTSSRSFLSFPKLKCRCEVKAIIRTVRNGDNTGMQFYSCPKWHVNANPNDLEDLCFQVLKRDTQVAEKEIDIDFMKEQLKKVEKNLGMKEDELNDMELCHTRIELMKASRNEKTSPLLYTTVV
uniref:GRF-type domain-containing protein n=1 Tax=Chenopodium quinoa TaxID=63459 RepID=A0A803MP34_CHEQI